MLTRQGWLTAVAAIAVVAAGRLFGIFELFVLGAAMAGVLTIAVASVWATRLQLGVARRLEPPRVHAGSPARVELHVTNESRRRTPVLRLHDPVSGTRGASLLVAPVAPSATVRAAYLLPTERRGVLGVGPLRVTVADPFGLAASSLTTVGHSELVVYPRIDRVAGLAPAPGRDSSSATRRPNTLGRTGDDFYTLRPYVIGDDLRRVHWPSTARHGELMIRQHELPSHERTTVLLDTRAVAHSPASFELAVSAAASVLNASVQRSDQVRLVTTGGLDSGYGAGRSQLEACLLHLAMARIEPDASLQRSLELLARRSAGGNLVLVAAALAASDLRRMGSLGLRFGRVVAVVFEPSSWDPSGVDQAAPGLPNLVRVTGETAFAEAWNSRFRAVPNVRPNEPAAVAQ